MHIILRERSVCLHWNNIHQHKHRTRAKLNCFWFERWRWGRSNERALCSGPLCLTGRNKARVCVRVVVRHFQYKRTHARKWIVSFVMCVCVCKPARFLWVIESDIKHYCIYAVVVHKLSQVRTTLGPLDAHTHASAHMCRFCGLHITKNKRRRPGDVIVDQTQVCVHNANSLPHVIVIELNCPSIMGEIKSHFTRPLCML